jgi:16S rRNA (cytidine1402-2'-O)-methyltransferase
LRDALDVLGDRRVAIARELTKVFEEIWRGTLSQAVAHFEQTPPRGEFTLVIAGAEDVVETWDEDEVRRALAREREAGATAKEAVQTVVALSGWSRRDVYRLWVELDNNDEVIGDAS